ncbi:MAG: hypothetical protein Crog4KO_19080 [Crocinitomicaceae bacterium]
MSTALFKEVVENDITFYIDNRLFSNKKFMSQFNIGRIEKVLVVNRYGQIIKNGRQNVEQQVELAKLGYYDDRIDGVIGNNSRTGVQKYKNDFQLTEYNGELILKSDDHRFIFEGSDDFVNYLNKMEEEQVEIEVCITSEGVSLTRKYKGREITISTSAEMVVTIDNETNDESFSVGFTDDSQDDDKENDKCELTSEICFNTLEPIPTISVGLNCGGNGITSSSDGTMSISSESYTYSKSTGTD